MSSFSLAYVVFQLGLVVVVVVVLVVVLLWVGVLFSRASVFVLGVRLNQLKRQAHSFLQAHLLWLKP